jgi:hypothetical protein
MQGYVGLGGAMRARRARQSLKFTKIHKKISVFAENFSVFAENFSVFAENFSVFAESVLFFAKVDSVLG